jgi:hypothetical protein
MIGGAVVVFNLTLISWRIHNSKHRKREGEPTVTKVPVKFDDGSVAWVDPNDPNEVALVASMQQPTAPSETFYSPTAGGMPAKDISEYDFSKEDYEVKTAGPVREDIYD